MDPVSGEPDVLGKVDALLTRHRTGTPSPQESSEAGQQADRASIPVLSEVVAEPSTIPILTDALPPVKAGESETGIDEEITLPVEPMPTDHADTEGSATSLSLDEETLRQTEEFLIHELENRIAMEFAATLDRALTELLDNSREHIRHTVREAFGSRLKEQAGDTSPDKI
ncbi:MAG TPA: hypothetical protein VMV75_00650 [Sulfuricella sp.]|nr:hypothetical protein [Sulfuricella sp.]